MSAQALYEQTRSDWSDLGPTLAYFPGSHGLAVIQ